MPIQVHKSAFRRQAIYITLGGGLIVALTIFLGMMSLARFGAVEAAWEDHSKRASAIGGMLDIYIQKYKQLGALTATDQDLQTIDAFVKESDAKDLKALDILENRLGKQADNTQKKALKSYAEAVYFLKILTGLLILTVATGIALMILFLRRVVVANEGIIKRQEQLDILLDTFPDPMLNVSPKGDIVRANMMASTFFGYTTDELLGMRIEQLLPSRFRKNHPRQRRKYFKKPEHRSMGSRSTLQALTKDGREPFVEISLSHTGSGENRLATVNVLDVTEREQGRLELEHARKRAESALKLQGKLQAGLVESEKMAALGGLVAGIAHEINTPIGVALTSATHLSSETKKANALYRSGEMTEEALNDYFDTANQVAQMLSLNTQRASDLIQSFKQVAVDQTADKSRTYDLESYIQETLLSLKPHLKNRPIKIQVKCVGDMSVTGHAGGVSQVLTNFITNSVRYAFDEGQSGNINISVKGTKRNIKLVYKDDGNGISADLQKNVFDPFVTTGRSAGGSGLGLYIVYNIVTQSLKGSVELTSAENEGAKFVVRFPRVTAALN